MKHKFLLLQKAVVEDPDGVLTPAGQKVAHDYAVKWSSDSVRDLEAERRNPGLTGLFFDIRSDAQLAREFASETVKKSMKESIVMIRSEVATLPLGKLQKAGGPYVGPKGGKWADPEHTIPWKEGGGGGGKGGAEEPEDDDKGPKQTELPFGGAKKPAAGEKPGEQKPGKQLQIEHKHVPLNPNKPDHTGERNWVDHMEGLPTETHAAYSYPAKDAAGRRQYIPERQRMHDAIIADAFKGKTPVPAGQKPVAIMMMGGAASGKSTLVRKQFAEKGLLQNYVQINSDDVKEQLPEYDMATSDPRNTAKDAAAMVHEESSDVAGRMFEQAINPAAKHNLVFDGTGANAEKYGRMMENLKKLGYHVHLIYSDVPNPDDAIQRAKDRANRTGRWVPEHHARAAHASIPQNFENVAGGADSYAMYAMEHGKPHREIMTGQAGRHEIHDPNYVAEFRGRAQKLKTEAAAKKQAAPAAQPAAQPAPGNSPSQPVAKSMTARYHEDVVRKAFPPGPQQQRFVMTRQAPGAPPAAPPHPGAAPGAPPGPGAPMAPKPPMPGPTAPPAAGAVPAGATAPAPGAPGAPPAPAMMTPDFNFDAFHRAVLDAKPEAPAKGKAAKPAAKAAPKPGTAPGTPPGEKAAKPTGKPGEAPDTPEDTTPFPEDDFSWAVAATENALRAHAASQAPAVAGPAAPGGPAGPRPPGPPGAPPAAPPPAAKPPFQKF